MITGQSDRICIIPWIPFVCFIQKTIQFHVTGKEFVVLYQGLHFLCIRSRIYIGINETQIHTEAKSIGKTFPLSDIFVEYQIRHIHTTSIQSSFCRIYLT